MPSGITVHCRESVVIYEKGNKYYTYTDNVPIGNISV